MKWTPQTRERMGASFLMKRMATVLDDMAIVMAQRASKSNDAHERRAAREAANKAMDMAMSIEEAREAFAAANEFLVEVARMEREREALAKEETSDATVARMEREADAWEQSNAH